MTYPELRYGMSNKAVLAFQNAVHRALAELNLPHENARNKGFGHYTGRDLCRFRRAVMRQKGPINCKAIGSDVWKAIQPWLGDYDRSLIRQHNRAVAAARAEVKARRLAAKKANQPATLRARVKAVALRHYAERAHYVYRQYRPMPDCLFCPVAYRRLDCSSSFTLHHKEGGAPDPNGRGYDGQGYTGTLVNRGHWTSNPQPGDAFFYGDQGGGVPGHVVTAVSAATGVSFGSTPVRLVSRGYRGDYRGAKSYL